MVGFTSNQSKKLSHFSQQSDKDILLLNFERYLKLKGHLQIPSLAFNLSVFCTKIEEQHSSKWAHELLAKIDNWYFL